MTADPVPPAAPLVVMVGAPGSGKSTWAAARFPYDQLFGLDMFRRILSGDVLEQNATGAAVDMLTLLVGYRMRTGRTTVVDATNAGWGNRDNLRYAAQSRGRPAVAVMLHTPLKTCVARQSTRGAGGPPWPGANDKAVPATVVQRMFREIEKDPPDRAEFDLVVHVHPDEPQVAYALCPHRHPVGWAERLLAEPWGAGITLLSAPAARLPWATTVNDTVARG